jgi:hypothetical protein
MLRSKLCCVTITVLFIFPLTPILPTYPTIFGKCVELLFLYSTSEASGYVLLMACGLAFIASEIMLKTPAETVTQDIYDTLRQHENC